ncbi:MAG: hypothetical protein QM785_05760 [Pyrinomonadaceae bacterium]
MASEIREILKNAQETLATAHAGVVQARSTDPLARRVGIRNAIVFGRSVTFVLQNLRSKDDRFDKWYKPWQEKMKENPAFQYLKELRNAIEKQGKLQTSATMNVTNLDMGLLMTVVGPTRPPEASSFFLGDSLGGCGWTVELPSGEVEKFYLQLPRAKNLNVAFDVQFGDAPDAIKQKSAVTVCAEYVSFLNEVLQDAKDFFLD